VKYSLFLYTPLFLLLLIIIILISISVGSVNISCFEIVDMCFGSLKEGQFPQSHWDIVFRIRLPRIFLAILVGAGLSIAGVAFQAFLRNPLADPYIVGVSAGAAVGAGLSFLFKLNLLFHVISLTPVAAFMGALFTVFIVYRLSLVRGKVPVETFLLSGVIVGSFLWALVSFVMFLSREDLHRLIFWIMGSLAEKNWTDVFLLLPYLLTGSIILWMNSRALNVMTLGDEASHYLGVEVERTKFILIIASSLITAATVSVSGIIGFVGLIVPHIVRMIFGSDHRVVLPLSGLVGAILLVFSDTLARTLLVPMEIPVGIITALLGAPFFCYLLRKRKFSFF